MKVRVNQSYVERIETAVDIIEFARITLKEFERLSRACVIPPPALRCNDTHLYAAYTSNIVAFIVEVKDHRHWIHANAPLLEVLNVQGVAQVLDLPSDLVVKALRCGALPQPAYRCTRNAYWYRSVIESGIEQIKRNILELKPAIETGRGVCFNAVYAAVGNELQLNRFEFDARLLEVHGTAAQWQIDTADGPPRLAVTGSDDSLRWLLTPKAAGGG